MARSIRFISPVESLSGNLSGAQELLYPTHDNSAFESPEDAVNYARNYKPRFVGTYRRKDGSVSFQVKTRTAVHMTPAMVEAMALSGGVNAIIAAMLRIKTGADYRSAVAAFDIEQEQGAGWKSLRQYMDSVIRQALSLKQTSFFFTPLHTIGNPFNFVAPGGAIATNIIEITQKSTTKFFPYLNQDGGIVKFGQLKQPVPHDATLGDIASQNGPYHRLNYFNLKQVTEVSVQGYEESPAHETNIIINAPESVSVGDTVQCLCSDLSNGKHYIAESSSRCFNVDPVHEGAWIPNDFVIRSGTVVTV